MIEIQFIEKLSFLLDTPSRYKVLYGGRGGGKSEGVATALIILSLQKSLRIACFREFQKSIKESVHSLIKQKIYDMKMENEFDIYETSIKSKRNGSEFIFAGLKYNINNIKSMARIDIAWVEEANNVSGESWKKLGPTIRGRHASDPNGMGGPFNKGPEIIITFNPEMIDDETYQRFVVNPPSEFDEAGERFIICKKINYTDNPWFPADLKAEMEQTKARNMDEYLEVWEGNVKTVLDGAIYADELRQVLIENRRGVVRYDPNRPVYTAWDLGHSDKTAIWFIQRAGLEYNLIDYHENSLKKMPYYISLLQNKGYNYATHYLPHDGSHETLTNITPEKQLKAVGYNVKVVERPSKKMIAINAVRSILPMCNFDLDATEQGWKCLSRYAYKVDPETRVFSKEPEHDTPWSHGCDGFSTLALSLKTEQDTKKLDKSRDRISLFPRQGSWMRGA